MPELRIGSLFSGTGQLDEGVKAVHGGRVVWHSQYEPPKDGKEDTNQYAARILAHHYPTVPNLGDITAIDWQQVITEHGPIDILTGGFPCQDVSSAGKRAGLNADTRSGLWAHMAHAIHELEPKLVVIENVQGLLSANADRGLGLDDEAMELEASAGRTLRALGAVLGDLATLGFHAEWARVAASEVGAPHPRKRIFIYAWPTDVNPRGLGRRDGQGLVGRLGPEGRDAAADADPADLGHEGARTSRRRGHGPADSGQPATDAQGARLQGLRPEPEGSGPERGGAAPADTDCVEPQRRGVPGVLGSPATEEPRQGDQRERAGDAAGCSREAATDAQGHGHGHPGPASERGMAAATVASGDPAHADTDGRGLAGHGELPPGRDALQRGVRHDADGRHPATPDAPSLGRGEGRTEPARVEGRPDAAQRGSATHADADSLRRRADLLNLRPGQPDLDWGAYGPAIRRWEAVLGRPAPWPTDALGRLSPVFSEWLMGYPDGWVTCVPGLTRGAMLRALGNGVVPQQAAAAIRLLHERAIADELRATA